MLKGIRNLIRFQQITGTLVRFGFGELLGRLNLLRYLKKELPPEQLRATRAVRFRLMLESLGTTFIKLGQILSTRPDVLPPDIVAELANLQDAVTPIPWELMSVQLDNDTGRLIRQDFVVLETTPIASASIAQVYAGTLRTGEKLALKIIRPGIDKVIREDLQILEVIGKLVKKHVSEANEWDVDSIIEQFRVSIRRELDLQHEGRNADIFRRNFAHDPAVTVPRIYWDYTNRQILAMEYIDGRRLQEFFDPAIPLETRRALAETGAHAVLRQIFEHGFFQADPHPGNALVMPGNVICFLDFGMFGRLDNLSQEALGMALQAIVKKDVERLLKSARELGILYHTIPGHDIRTELFDLLEQYHGRPLRQISMPNLVRDILSLIARHRLRVRPDFIFLLKALATVEATGRKLDPDFDIISHIAPFVRRMLLQRFAPSAIWANGVDFVEDVYRLGREAPEHVLEILRSLRTGQQKLDLNLLGFDQSLQELNKVIDKAVVGVLIGLVTVASSIMAHAQIGPKLFDIPLIGGVMFLIAGVTGIWYIFDLLNRRK